jgi:Integrase zinc binding domain/Integrase core domain
VVRSDQASLSWVFGNCSSDTPRLARFGLRLSGLDFVVQFLSGRKNLAADGMSRCSAEIGTSKDRVDYDIPCLVVQDLPPRSGPILKCEEWNAITVGEMKTAQEGDSYCSSIMHSLDSLGCHEIDAHGLLLRLSTLDHSAQVVVPQSMRDRVLSLAHNPKVSGHPGSGRLYAMLRKNFFWPQMAADTKAFVSRCPSCARKRLKSKGNTQTMNLFPPASALGFVEIDILGSLPTTSSGNRFFPAISDRFSKLVRTVPMKSTTADLVSMALFNEWLSMYGVPLILLSDNGPQFCSRFFQSVCAMLGIQQLFTATNRPQTNGQAERFNRTVLGMLCHYVSKNQKNWDELVRALVYGYNCQPHTSTGLSSFELVLYRPPSLPIMESRPLSMLAKDKCEFRNTFLKKVQMLTKATKEKLDQSQERYRRVFDEHVRVRNKNVQPDDLTFTSQTGVSPKLLSPAAGPHPVVKRDDRTFTVYAGNGEIRVDSDRVTKAPMPEDLSKGVAYISDDYEETDSASEDVGDTKEYSVDRFVGHGDIDGILHLNVRWFGFDVDADTWEPWTELSLHMVEGYLKKRKVPLQSVSRQCPSEDART